MLTSIDDPMWQTLEGGWRKWDVPDWWLVYSQQCPKESRDYPDRFQAWMKMRKVELQELDESGSSPTTNVPGPSVLIGPQPTAPYAGRVRPEVPPNNTNLGSIPALEGQQVGATPCRTPALPIYTYVNNVHG